MQTQKTNFDKFEEEVVNKFNELNNKNKEGWTNKDWTNGVKDAVGSVLKNTFRMNVN